MCVAQAPEVLMCHNKAKPEDYKDRTQLVYNSQVRAMRWAKDESNAQGHG